MLSVSMTLEQFFKFIYLLLALKLSFLGVHTHRKLLTTNLSMFLYHSDMSIAPAH